jgi:hypothetical protein
MAGNRDRKQSKADSWLGWLMPPVPGRFDRYRGKPSAVLSNSRGRRGHLSSLWVYSDPFDDGGDPIVGTLLPRAANIDQDRFRYGHSPRRLARRDATRISRFIGGAPTMGGMARPGSHPHALALHARCRTFESLIAHQPNRHSRSRLRPSNSRCVFLNTLWDSTDLVRQMNYKIDIFSSSFHDRAR